MQTAGDAAVAFLLTVVAYRAYGAWSESRFKTLRYHTTGMPPALIANDFSFEKPETNRKVASRGELDKFRDQLGERKVPLEEYDFSYVTYLFPIFCSISNRRPEHRSLNDLRRRS